MDDKKIYHSESAQKNKGKNWVFSLVFCVLAVLIAGAVLIGAGKLLHPAAVASGAPAVSS